MTRNLHLLIVACLLAVQVASAQEKPPPEAWQPKEEPPKEETPKADPPKEDPPGETVPAKERAMAKAKQAAELAQNGQYADAASIFQESLNIHPMTDVYFNLAYCHEQIGDWKGCVSNYEKYLQQYRKEHSGADPAEIISIKRSIEKCRETAQPPISIASTPPGAQVGLGAADQIIGTTPVTKKLAPGTYKLFLTKEGYQSVETKIVVQAKQEGNFHFDLQQIVNAGKVEVRVNVRDATIYIDGKPYGISPYMETPVLPIGKHQIVIKKERYSSVNTTFEVTHGAVTKLDFNLFLQDPPPSWRSYIGWASVSIGLVTVAGGVVASRFAEQEFNDTDDYAQFELLQNIGYGLGGGLLGLGTILLIWEAASDSVDTDDLIDQSAAPYNFSVTPTEGGVFMQGGVRF